MDKKEIINELYNLIIMHSTGEKKVLLLKSINGLKNQLTKVEEKEYNKDMENFTIMFDDLNEEAQEQLLEFYGISSPEELNLDVAPLSEIIKEDYE